MVSLEIQWTLDVDMRRRRDPGDSYISGGNPSPQNVLGAFVVDGDLLGTRTV